MKQNRDREFRRHVVEGFNDVSRALFDHACGKERRIGHVVGLRRSILDVKVGHNSHLRADDGRISLPIYPDKQTVSEPVGTSQKCQGGSTSAATFASVLALPRQIRVVFADPAAILADGALHWSLFSFPPPQCGSEQTVNFIYTHTF